MPSPSALPVEAAQALARGRTIVTSNQRAARTLQQAYDLDQQAANRTAWQPPAIFAWETWLNLLWKRMLLEGRATALLLNRSQEHSLWQEIIRGDPEAAASQTLRPVESLAELAARAWLLLHTHRARRGLSQFAGTADTRAFARWAAEFDLRSTRSNCLSAAHLTEVLAQAFAEGGLTLAPATGLLLVGFDTRTPAQTALLEALRQAGAEVDDVAPAAPPHHAQALVEAPAEHEELATCARWIRTHLTANPAARVAVIVPELEAERAALDRTLRHILAPELDDIAAPAEVGPFEFSLGVPLAQTSDAAAALDILAWSVAPLPLDRVSALLLSAHFAGGAERLARAEFDAGTIRREQLLQPELSVAAVDRLLRGSPQRQSLPQLDRHLRALTAVDLNPAAQQMHADWAATFARILHAAGWAETTAIGSIEFQFRRRWESALDELASLDFDGRRVGFAEALASLQRIAGQTLFAPQSRNAPVQIMGPLEAAGSTFDALWFLRAGDLSWPAAASPNPLLPWRLQRDLPMPGANPATDSGLARRITERLAASAPFAIFSYAVETSAGLQRPSPALSGIALEPCAADEFALPEPAAAPVRLDSLADETAVPPPPDRVLQGGSGILSAQAACAFRAFAEKRLGSRAPDSRELGLDAAKRGELVHDVLQKFWGEVHTQAALKLLSPDERDHLLFEQIDAVLEQTLSATAPGWPQAYVATERQRLHNLLSRWLDYEAKRAAFAVRAREHTINDVAVGPLRIDIRIDRIDTYLVDGEPKGEVLLDYKTSTVKPADWLGDRPDEPQVPLYAIVGEANPLAAVAFASIRPGNNIGISGYQATDGVLPKGSRLKAASLDEQVAEWRTVLESLATQFHAGVANVAPKQHPTTCRHCKQRLLCRLDPASLEPESIEDLAEPQASDSEAEFA